MPSLYDKEKVRRRVEPMTVWIPEIQDENFLTSMEDMQGYIERQGGILERKTNSYYRFYVPTLWTGKLWQRFRSFGITAKLSGGTIWSDELELQSKV